VVTLYCTCECDNVSDSPDKKFINAGLWVSSILFLALALLAGVLAAVFAVVNTTTNPMEPIAGVLGLYVWNGIAGKPSDMMTVQLFQHGACGQWTQRRFECLEQLELVPPMSILNMVAMLYLSHQHHSIQNH
jgi:hypothetical protein